MLLGGMRWHLVSVRVRCWQVNGRQARSKLWSAGETCNRLEKAHRPAIHRQALLSLAHARHQSVTDEGGTPVASAMEPLTLITFRAVGEKG